MALIWTEARKADFRDAYLDWSRLLEERRRGLAPVRVLQGEEFEPIFVRLKQETGADATAARRALSKALDAPGATLQMDAHERGLLEARIAEPETLSGLADEYALYRRLGTPDADHAALFDILDTGVPVDLKPSDRSTPDAQPLAKGKGAGQPILAVVDDGIGFLNARFRKPGGRETRFHALWMQALETRDQRRGDVVSGIVLTRSEIDAMIASGGEEDAYAALSSRLFAGEGRRSLLESTSHGSHVLDLAGGADPDGGDPACDWPLLGVQLPPQAIEDTSGTRCESYMVQGMRWVLHQARALDATAPVIVNFSLGILAGPKDGSRFAEYQIAREARLWEEATGQAVQVVWAFGNTYADDLVARTRFAAAKTPSEAELTWRVQPGDQTASYLEIYSQGPLPQIGLATPDGSASEVASLAPGSLRTLERDGAPVARIYHVPEQPYGEGRARPAHLVLTLSPTEARKTGEPEAPAGAWTIAVRQAGGDASDIVFQIQRDDALRGMQAQARQSYFDARDAYDWSDEALANIALSPDGALTYAGSHNALASVRDPRVWPVGAARRSDRSAAKPAQNYRPAWYSAEGADWSLPGPRVSTVGDDGGFLRGVTGAGTQSGAVRFASGTSAAAGRFSRALALLACRGGSAKGDALVSALEAVSRQAIAVDPADQPRLGTYIVDEPEAIPARRD